MTVDRPGFKQGTDADDLAHQIIGTLGSQIQEVDVEAWSSAKEIHTEFTQGPVPATWMPPSA